MGVRIAQAIIANLPAGAKKAILDVDDTDDPCHGQQELELFNCYYGEHCYKPLYIHLMVDDGRQWLLGSLLRPGNSWATKGLLAACVLMGVLQESLSGTRWAGAQVGTIRLRLLKVGARPIKNGPNAVSSMTSSSFMNNTG